MPPADASATALTGQQRRFLRALIQPQKPVVQVGADGVTAGVARAVAQALRDHELIKVRLQESDDRFASAEDLARMADAHLCGVVGHTVILYRRHPERPRIVLPGAARSAPRGEPA